MLSKALGKLSKSLGKKRRPSFSWLGEQGSSVHSDFCCTVLISHGLYAFSLVKQSKWCDFYLRDVPTPAQCQGLRNYEGKEFSFCKEGFVFIES